MRASSSTYGSSSWPSSLPSPLRLLVGTWVAAILGALAGRTLADHAGTFHDAAPPAATQPAER